MFLGHDQSGCENVHLINRFDKVLRPPELEGKKMRWVPYPPDELVQRYDQFTKADQRPNERDNVPIFVGQVPNMLPLRYLGWAIDTIVGGYIVTNVQHAKKSGCAVAWVRECGAKVLFEKSRRVLFDVRGFWFPETDAEVELLHNYVADLRAGQYPEVHKDGRIPKSCMVFEQLGRPRQNTQAPPDLGHLQPRNARGRRADGTAGGSPATPYAPGAGGTAGHPGGMPLPQRDADNSWSTPTSQQPGFGSEYGTMPGMQGGDWGQLDTAAMVRAVESGAIPPHVLTQHAYMQMQQQQQQQPSYQRGGRGGYNQRGGGGRGRGGGFGSGFPDPTNNFSAFLELQQQQQQQQEQQQQQQQMPMQLKLAAQAGVRPVAPMAVDHMGGQELPHVSTRRRAHPASDSPPTKVAPPVPPGFGEQSDGMGSRQDSTAQLRPGAFEADAAAPSVRDPALPANSPTRANVGWEAFGPMKGMTAGGDAGSDVAGMGSRQDSYDPMASPFGGVWS